MGKILISGMFLSIAVVGQLFAQKAQGEADKKWAVPNVAYNCEATIGQDWSRDRMENSFIHSKTKAKFLVNMPTWRQLF